MRHDKKRENYRLAYNNFDPNIVAEFNEEKVLELLNNNGIIRSRLKIKSSINNTKRFVEIQKQYGSFSSYIWNYADHKPVLNNRHASKNVPDEIFVIVGYLQRYQEKRFYIYRLKNYLCIYASYRHGQRSPRMLF